VNFQRDLVVGWIIHIELKVRLLSRRYIYIYIYIYIIPSLTNGALS